MKDQRKFPRIATLRPRPTCAVKLGNGVVSGLILDESKGGWAILITDRPAIQTGQAIVVRDERGWYAAKVMHVEPILATSFLASRSEWDIGEENRHLSATEGELWLRLGVQRGEKIAVASASPDSLPENTPSNWRPLNLLRRVAGLLP